MRSSKRLIWNLTEDEAWTLIMALLDTLRTGGAVLFPDDVSPRDEAFLPRNKELYVRENTADPKMGILSRYSPRLNNNRFCHDELKRGRVIEFLGRVLS